MKNQVIVITGSTRGLGYAIAEAMLKAGATVVISGRSAEALQEAVKKLSRHGAVAGRRCDLRKESQVYALARWVVAHFGGVDVWVNNAGYSASAGRILDLPPDQAALNWAIHARGDSVVTIPGVTNAAQAAENAAAMRFKLSESEIGELHERSRTAP